MRPIRSVIVFNSGSAGDFLTALCWSQLNVPPELYKQMNNGRLLIDNLYFKKTTEQYFYNKNFKIEFDYSKVRSVVNTHYWLDCYRNLADRSVYINYPDAINQDILRIYIEKVYGTNKQAMIDFSPHLNSYLASKTTVDNVVQIFSVHWHKNIQSWRQNSNLSAVELADFFHKSKMETIVEALIDQKISNQEQFNNIYQNWVDTNSGLKQLLC